MRRIHLFWIFAVVIIAVIIYLPGLSKYLKLKTKEVKLQHEVERLQAQITQLQTEEHLLKTDLTRLEEVVREELGLVKPGEVVYKVVEEEISSEPPKHAETAAS